jgi:hypothetical protein
MLTSFTLVYRAVQSSFDEHGAFLACILQSVGESNCLSVLILQNAPAAVLTCQSMSRAPHSLLIDLSSILAEKEHSSSSRSGDLAVGYKKSPGSPFFDAQT